MLIIIANIFLFLFYFWIIQWNLKHKKIECESFKYIKILYANIWFCNYAHLYGYNYKKISILPKEIDPRKYLDKIKKPEAKELQDALNLDLAPYKEKEKEREKEISKKIKMKLMKIWLLMERE